MTGQISDTLRKAGVKIQNLASLSRGDLAYVVVDLDAPAPADTLKAIGSSDGVLMIREL
jgi:MinD-like ATPase involved in chromosome partitioning or flagellar assembly